MKRRFGAVHLEDIAVLQAYPNTIRQLVAGSAAIQNLEGACQLELVVATTGKQGRVVVQFLPQSQFE